MKMQKFSGNKWRERFKLIHDIRYNYKTGKYNDAFVWIPIWRVTKPNKGGHTHNYISNMFKCCMRNKGTALQKRILDKVFEF